MTPPTASAPPDALDVDLDAPTFHDEEGEAQTLAVEFSTATMGHVLLGQGRPEEALAVFRSVLARNPDDDDARRGIALVTGKSASEPPPAASEVAAAEDEDLRTWARSLPVDPHTLAVYWNLRTEDLLAVGATAQTACALVIVSHRVGPWGLERAERLVEHLPRAGERVEGTLTDGAMHHAAVGVFVSGAFVPLARAVPVSTPPAELPPVLTSAAEALPVLLPSRPGLLPPPASTPAALSPSSAAAPAANAPAPAAEATAATAPAVVATGAEGPDPILYAFFAAAWARGVSSSPSTPG
jgi:hypothetical protein